MNAEVLLDSLMVNTWHPSGPGGNTLDNVICLSVEDWEEVKVVLAAEAEGQHAKILELALAAYDIGYYAALLEQTRPTEEERAQYKRLHALAHDDAQRARKALGIT